MNLVILKGNIGSDPIIRSYEWGKTAIFSLATSETYTDKKGEKITKTEWHNIVFYGTACDVIDKHLHKGDSVIVTGKIKTRSYEDKDGANKTITEIICDRFEFCGSKREPEKVENNEGKFQKNGVVSKDDIMNLPDDRPTPEQIGNMPVAENTDDLPF